MIVLPNLGDFGRTSVGHDGCDKWFWRCDCGWIGYGLGTEAAAVDEADRHERDVHVFDSGRL